MALKAILFDLDNTLIDFIGMKKKASQAAAKAMLDVGLETDIENLEESLYDFYLDYGIESDDAFETFIQDKLGFIDYRVLAAAVNAYLKEKYSHLEAYPKTRETLTELKKRGYKLGVVSDGLRLKAWMRLNAVCIDNLFDTVVTHEDTGKFKPEPEPFLKACKGLEVKPEECMMVGDWPERDIEGAKNVGMRTCWAKYGQVKEDMEIVSDCSIDKIEDLMNIMKVDGENGC